MTATDRGHIEEIITHLQKVEQDYKINLSSEKEWLRGLDKSPVWHDMSVKADIERQVLVISNHGQAFTGYINSVLSPKHIKQWAYIDDLLKL